MFVFDLRNDHEAINKLWAHMLETWKYKTVWKMRWDQGNKCFAVFGNGAAYLI